MGSEKALLGVVMEAYVNGGAPSAFVDTRISKAIARSIVRKELKAQDA